MDHPMIPIGSRHTMPTNAAPPEDATLSPPPPWADLPPDLLREISGRLHTAGNFLRFHAVCASWRDSVPPPDRRRPVLPWLLSPPDSAGRRYARCHILCTSKSCPYLAAEVRVRGRRWVTSADDGTARYCLQTTPPCAFESPVDPLTGIGPAAAIPIPDEVERWWGEHRSVGASVAVSCADGTIALCNYDGHSFHAALLHPGGGDAEWTLVPRNGMGVPGVESVDWRLLSQYQRDYCVSFRHGKIILSYRNLWRIVHMTEKPAAGDDQGWSRMPREPGKFVSSGHLVETRGELLWVFIQLDEEYLPRCDRGHADDVNDDLASALSVSVFVLHDKVGAPRWVKREGRSLADCVMFLGPGRSFAVDAAGLGITSGCAYFVDRKWSFYASNGKGGRKYISEQSRVFKYSFSNAKSEFVDELPPKWNRKPFMWISPRPAIASTKEIRSRTEHFRIYVGNLPPNVDSNQLRQFFLQHGKVADARIMYHRKTRCSLGFGFVTMMATKDDEPADIIAKVHGESFDGRPLQVKLADYQSNQVYPSCH